MSDKPIQIGDRVSFRDYPEPRQYGRVVYLPTHLTYLGNCYGVRSNERVRFLPAREISREVG